MPDLCALGLLWEIHCKYKLKCSKVICAYLCKLQVIGSWEEWLINQMHVTSWRIALTRTSEKNAKSCTLGGTNPHIRTSWDLTSWKAAWQRGSRHPDSQQVSRVSAMCSCGKKRPKLVVAGKNVVGRLRDEILPHYSALHLEHCPHVLGYPVQEQRESTGISLAKGHKGHQGLSPMKTGWGSRGCSARREGSVGIHQSGFEIPDVCEVKKMDFS